MVSVVEGFFGDRGGEGDGGGNKNTGPFTMDLIDFGKPCSCQLVR